MSREELKAQMDKWFSATTAKKDVVYEDPATGKPASVPDEMDGLLSKAQRLERAGKRNEEIRRETGWFRSNDGMWRYEVPEFDFDFSNLF